MDNVMPLPLQVEDRESVQGPVGGAEGLRLKRRALELEHIEAWLRGGRFEKKQILRSLLRAGLWLTGLRSRGERNALDPVVREMRFEFDTLPEAFSGFRILHLSDLHIDGHDRLAENICRRVRGLEVDLCVLTGDYRFEASGPSHDVYRNMEKILGSINARCGTVGILGNHDFMEKVPKLERMGVRMLVNEALELQNGRESVWLVGLDDPYHYGCDDLPGALAGVPDNAFKILLVHSPEVIEQAAEGGVSLYLCGHTHGGQICLPHIGPLMVSADCPRRVARGVWEYGKVRGYTSAGAGCSILPVRFFCPPEIGLIELHGFHMGVAVSEKENNHKKKT